MSNNPKLFIRKTCVEVTFRTEEGLPLVAAPYIRVIIQGIFARAQSLYPISICHFTVMANHLHLIIVIESPHLVPSFFAHFKGETAHAINRLLGRKKHTVWCDGYDSPRILDANTVIDRIVYLYTNPQKAGLVERIEDYPQYSSWQAFLDGAAEVFCNRIPRDAIPQLPQGNISLKRQQEIADELLYNGREEVSFFIDPDAWMDCFPELAESDPHEIKDEIIKRIRAKEKQFRSERKGAVTGAHALRLESIRKEHTPKKRGKRMLCLSSDKPLRLKFISWFRARCAEAREWYCQWSAGNTNAIPPPGMFAPGGNLFANLIPAFLPV